MSVVYLLIFSLLALTRVDTAPYSQYSEATANGNLMVCYVNNEAGEKEGEAQFLPYELDPTLCDYGIYGFAGIGEDFQIYPTNPVVDLPKSEGGTFDGYGRFGNLRRRHPYFKTLIGIGGYIPEFNDRFSEMVSTEESQKVFIDSVLAFLKSGDFDGVNIDWYDPSLRDKRRYSKLVEDLKAAFAGSYSLSVTVSGHIGELDDGYDLATISNNVEFISLRAYNLHDYTEGFTHHHTAYGVYAESLPKDKLLNAFDIAQYAALRVPDSRKLVLGIPSYAHTYTLLQEDHGIYAEATYGLPGPITAERGLLSYYEICDQYNRNSGNWSITTDVTMISPYATYAKYSDGNLRNQWVAYDNEKSIEKKCELVKDLALGGAMLWSLDLDDFTGNYCKTSPFSLLRLIRNKCLNEPTPSPTTTELPTTTEEPTPISTPSTTTQEVPTTTEEPTPISTPSTTATEVPTTTKESTPITTPSTITTELPTTTEEFTPTSTPSTTATEVPITTKESTPISTPSTTATEVPTTTKESTPITTVPTTTTVITTTTEKSTPITKVPTTTEETITISNLTTTTEEYTPTTEISTTTEESIPTTIATTTTPLPEEGLVVCYVASRAAVRPSDGAFYPWNMDPTLCTHGVYGFAGISYNYTIKSLNPNFDYGPSEGGNNDGYRQFASLRENNKDFKALLGVGGYDAISNGLFSEMVKDVIGRKKFIDSAIVFLNTFGFDGLNIDWYFPGNDPHDKDNLTAFLQTMRSQFAEYGLSLSIAASAMTDVLARGYNLKSIAEQVEFMSIMAFDFHTCDSDRYTHHHTPLRAHPNDRGALKEYNVESAVQYFINENVPPQKLLLGIPTYGRTYTLEEDPSNENNTIYRAAHCGIKGPLTRQAGYLSQYEICEESRFRGSEGPWRNYWNEDMHSSYAVYENDGYDNQWISYDTKETIERKCKLATSLKFGGAMIWSVDSDDFQGNYCDQGPFPVVRLASKACAGR